MANATERKKKRSPLGAVSYLAEKCVCGHSMMYHDFSSPNPKRRWCGSCDCNEYRVATPESESK